MTPHDSDSRNVSDSDQRDAPDASDGDSSTPEAGSAEPDGPRGREVVVPMRLYKTVTVVATLLAMVGVVGGFVLLDAATNRGSAASLEEIDPVVALLGLAFLVGGAATYAFSTRFRAEGMGRSKTDEEQDSGDG